MVEKIEVNLIPSEYRVHQKRFKIKNEVLIPVLISTLLISGSFGWFKFLEKRKALLTTEIAAIESEIRANKHIQVEIENLRKKKNSMQAKIKGLKSINVNRDKWVRLFELYCKELPKNSWITDITETPNGNSSQVTLKGMTEAFGEVGQYIARLVKEDALSSVKLVEIRDKGKDGKMLAFEIQQQLAASPENNNSTATAE